MNDTHRLAQLIISCWRISGEGESGRIPTSHGLLDRALKATLEDGSFPEWARQRLHFVDSRIGLQCVELPAILEWAQRAQLTSAPNPSYETTEVQVSGRVAHRLLKDLDVAEIDGRAWGDKLRSAINEAKAALASVDHSMIEEY